MQKIRKIFVVSLAIIFISGCASMSQPKRATYTGADNVGTVTPEMIIGSWNVKSLNPTEGEETTSIKSKYTPDGTVVMNVIPQAAASPMGTIELEMVGAWSIEGDNILMQLKSMKETSGNKMANMIVGMMGSMKEKMGGKANIYEASADRIVMVADDGSAQEWTRTQ